MRLRNIPGAKDAITESPYVVQNPEECKGKWEQVFTQEQPIHIEVGMGKGRFLMDMATAPGNQLYWNRDVRQRAAPRTPEEGKD